MRLNLTMTPVEFGECDMEWYHELIAVRDAYHSGQTSAQETAAAIKAEIRS